MYVNIHYCADLQCILFIVLSDQTGNSITVKVEAVSSAQEKRLVETNRARNRLTGKCSQVFNEGLGPVKLTSYFDMILLHPL